MKILNLVEPQATFPLNWPVVVAAHIAEKQPFSKLRVVLYLEKGEHLPLHHRLLRPTGDPPVEVKRVEGVAKHRHRRVNLVHHRR